MNHKIQGMIAQANPLLITEFCPIIVLKLLHSARCPRCAADRIDSGLAQVVEDGHGRGKVEGFQLLVTLIQGEIFFNHGLYLLQAEVIQADTGE